MTVARVPANPVLAAALLCLAVVAHSAVAQTAADLGRPIVDVIEELRDENVRIIYSGELLPARLRVTLVPTGGTPFERLAEILAPHGLGLELGPRETWLVIRRPAAVPVPESASPAGDAAGAAAPPAIETIVVTTSRYAFARPSAISAASITRHTLENATSLGQDPLRVTAYLPGVTGNQLSARSHIRGGNPDEVLLQLDGVRLYEPYHLKDFQSIFSSINPRVIESMDVRTGGYEARFGDRMSGVIDMRSVTPSAPRHYELSLSLLETAVLSSGVFAEGRGSWLTSLRRGNLDVVANAMDSTIGDPQYVDFFNEVAYAPSANSTLTAGVLTLDDKISLNDGELASATASYDDIYYWLTWERSAASGLETRLQASTVQLDRSRNGRIDDPARATGSLSESRSVDQTTLKADIGYELTSQLRVEAGAEIESADFDASVEAEKTTLVDIRVDDLHGPNAPPAAARVADSETRSALWLSFRLRPIERLTLDLGARRDAESLPDATGVSPRLNLRFELAARTSLRAAWGEFDQSQSLEESAIADGSLLPLPTEESEHAVLGIERLFGTSGAFRAEMYSKEISRLNHRFENVYERVSLIPELLPDRFEIAPMNARVQGVELSAEGEAGPFEWWANAALARTEERLATGTFERSWDEDWSLKLGGEWQGPAWTVTANATLHAGWPISGMRADNGALVADSFNAGRLTDFRSLDVRASRAVQTRHGEVEWYFEVVNLLDHENSCCVDYRYTPASGAQPERLDLEQGAIFGIVPNIGLRWQR